MDLEVIKKLMAAMNENGMTRVAIEEKDGTAIEIERKVEVLQVREQKAVEMPISSAEKREPLQEKPSIPPSEVKGFVITSPMVGTYYSSPSPDDPPFVQVGDMVREDTVVCIIEAMKVMNEVKAGKSGKVVEIYNDASHPVEYGTKLFRIEV